MIPIPAKSILSYTLLPHFKPRIEALFLTGFQFIAYFMALVYGAVQLLPPNHPYLRHNNIGKFGIRHVIAEAANNLTLNKKNIDQLILFVTILCGMVLILIQVLLLGFGMFIQPVFAAMPTSFAGFFITPDPTRDIAHIMMDLVFGIPGLFDSCISQTTTCLETLPAPQTGEREVMFDQVSGTSIYAGYGFPFPIHTGMHAMFRLYNTGLLVVAAMITTYFIVAVIAETAQTGTPFGKRFNKVWAPIRIVFAFGLLMPINYGLNTSQYAVLYAAKFGSGFATNGWTMFNSNLTTSYFGDARKLASMPNIPEITALAQFFYTARTCYQLEGLRDQNAGDPDIHMYAVKAKASAGGDPFLQISDSTDYETLINFISPPGPSGEISSTATIRFGTQAALDEEGKANSMLGTVNPICGEVVLKLTDPRNPAAADVAHQPEPGLELIQKYYWYILKEFWFDLYNGGIYYSGLTIAENYPLSVARRNTQYDPNPNLPEADNTLRTGILDFYRADLKNVLTSPATTGIPDIAGFTAGAIELMENSARYDVNGMISEKGWAGAGIWYNRIAEMNGAVTTAVLNVPHPTRYPALMEYVHRKKKALADNVDFDTRFVPRLANGDEIQFQRDQDLADANALAIAYGYWQNEGGSTPQNTPTGNAFIDSLKALFGAEGLYNIRRNPNVHPLAQIVGAGRSLVEASIRNLTLATVGGAAGRLLGFLGTGTEQVTQVQAAFLVTVTMVGLTAGFILFYVVPFLPFIYFFFAVGGWIKGIFEAMVGAPLWALAHIRIDQNGLPGQAAVSGYFLIFEIFIRPILMVFGLLASIATFAALVSVLHQVFDLVISNVGGFDARAEVEGVGDDGETILPSLEYARSQVDSFFFTILYTIIVYLMAMSSFKLIDLIPNNILRWMGQSIATFNDQREDIAQALVSKATVGSQQTSGALGRGLQSIAGTGGG